jgi:hypothetical protein
MADIKPPLVGISAHPYAAVSVRRWKSRAALAGFLLAAYESYGQSLPFADIALRAVAAGVVGYLIGYAAAVTVWRHLLQAQARLAVDRARELRELELARQQRARSD